MKVIGVSEMKKQDLAVVSNYILEYIDMKYKKKFKDIYPGWPMNY